jgi:excisionase family DNA binding protein
MEHVTATPHDDPTELLTIDQVAQLVKVNRATVYRWLAEDEGWQAIAHRPGGRYRFERGDVLELVRSRCAAPAAGEGAAA